MDHEENLATVRRMIEEPSGVSPEERDLLFDEFWDEECDYYPTRSFADNWPRHGREDVKQFFDAFYEAWESWDYKVARAEPVGDDRVFVQGRVRATGRESGLALDGEIFHAVWLRHGRILRMEDHFTERGARRALGLEAE